MADEADNVVLKRLAEIRASLEDHSRQLQALPRIERQLAALSGLLVQSALDGPGKMKSQPVREKSRLDELMEQFEKMSPAERKRSIEKANEILAANGGRLP